MLLSFAKMLSIKLFTATPGLGLTQVRKNGSGMQGMLLKLLNDTHSMVNDDGH